MSIELKMPALSPTMEEGTLAKWLVKEGDTVASGDILAEIETDKATMEFEAVDEGTIARILIPEGSDGVKVGTPIAILAGEGEERQCHRSCPQSRGGASTQGRRAEGRARAAGEGRGETPPRLLLRQRLLPGRTAAIASRRARSLGDSRRRKGSTFRRSRVPARVAALFVPI